MDRIRAMGNTAVEVSVRLAHQQSPYEQLEKKAANRALNARRCLDRHQTGRARLVGVGRSTICGLRSTRDPRRLSIALSKND
jgi:hypothetical protein